jgi:hypothetical protein
MMGLDLLVSDLDNAALGYRPKGMRRGDSALDPQGKQTDTVSTYESVYVSTFQHVVFSQYCRVFGGLVCGSDRKM